MSHGGRPGMPRSSFEDHSSEYERVITMLTMSQDQNLEITAQEFAQYVMDDWGWKQQWTQTTTAYAGYAAKS